MTVRESYPKLHSIKMKTGIHDPKVEFLPSAAYNKIDPRDVLIGAFNMDLEEIAIIGVDYWGREYVASSSPDPTLIAFMAARMQHIVVSE